MAAAFLMASCGAPTVPSKLAARTAGTAAVSPTVPRAPTSPATLPPFVTPSTVINTYPNPYDPGYTNMDQLVQDSIGIALGTLEAPEPGVASDGHEVMAYPVSVRQSFDHVPETSLGVDQAEVTAAHLSVGDTYIFFWGYDSSPDDTVCIVGGVRGVMAYDAATGTVTRLDHSTNSQIPRSQTLEQFARSVTAAQQLIGTVPGS
jgi:hypothetical protein